MIARLFAAVRAPARFLDDRLQRWSLGWHQPDDVHRDGTLLVCWTCSHGRDVADWPCAEYVRLTGSPQPDRGT